MSATDPEEQANRVKELLFAGQKIQAIKLYREQTGVGLRGAKDEVEKLEDELRTSSPDLFAKAPGRIFVPMVVILLVAAIAVAVGVMMWWITS